MFPGEIDGEEEHLFDKGDPVMSFLNTRYEGGKRIQRVVVPGVVPGSHEVDISSIIFNRGSDKREPQDVVPPNGLEESDAVRVC